MNNLLIRDALFNALTYEVGKGQSEIVIFLLQKDHGIRFIGGGESHALQDIEEALTDILGNDAQRVIGRMKKELGIVVPGVKGNRL